MKTIREVIYEIIDQELNPACFYDRNLSEIVYYNQQLIALFPNVNFLLLKIREHEFSYEQGMTVDLLGTKYDVFIFRIDDESIQGSIITVRNQNRTTLEHYDNKYFKTYNQPGIIINKQGHIESINLAFEESLGYVKQIIKHKSIQDLFVTSKLSLDQLKLIHHIASGKTYENEIIYIYNSNIQPVRMYLNVTTLYDKDTIIGAYLVFNKILNEVKTEKLVGAYQDIVNDMNEAVLITNQSFQILYANNSYLNLVGLSQSKEYLNKEVSFLIKIDYLRK